MSTPQRRPPRSGTAILMGPYGDAELTRKVDEIVRTLPRPLRAARFRAMAEVDVRDDFAALRCPILVLHGRGRLAGSEEVDAKGHYHEGRRKDGRHSRRLTCCFKRGPRQPRARSSRSRGHRRRSAMKLDGVPSRTIWLERDGWSVGILDQTLLPHKIERVTLADGRGCCACNQVDAGARRAADWRHGGLWRGARDARRRVRRRRSIAPCDSLPSRGRRRSICAGRSKTCARRSRRWLPMRAPLLPTLAPAQIAEDDVEMCRRIGLNGLDADQGSG